jgi:hypothetical protein
MRTLIAGLAEFERDLIKERIKSGLARVKAIIDRDGEYVTKAGKLRKKLGRKVGYRPSAKHDEKVLAMHRDGLPYRLIGRNLGLSKNTGDEDHKTRVDRGGGLIKGLPGPAAQQLAETLAQTRRAHSRRRNTTIWTSGTPSESPRGGRSSVDMPLSILPWSYVSIGPKS